MESRFAYGRDQTLHFFDFGIFEPVTKPQNELCLCLDDLRKPSDLARRLLYLSWGWKWKSLQMARNSRPFALSAAVVLARVRPFAEPADVLVPTGACEGAPRAVEADADGFAGRRLPLRPFGEVRLALAAFASFTGGGAGRSRGGPPERPPERAVVFPLCRRRSVRPEASSFVAHVWPWPSNFGLSMPGLRWQAEVPFPLV